MTGAEILAQVREALSRLRGSEFSADEDAGEAAERALDGCILLTAEEAEKVRRVIALDAKVGEWKQLHADVNAILQPNDGDHLRLIEALPTTYDDDFSRAKEAPPPWPPGDLGPTTDYDDVVC